MEFDLRQLQAFVEVVDRGGFSAAAQALHLSQAAVSERIANLEQGVGMRLLDRGARLTRPTSIGRRLYELARPLLAQREAIYLELAELAGVVRGTLVIGASTIPGEYVLPPLLSAFCAKHPLAELNIVINDSAAITDRVRAGELDAGVVGAKPADEKLHCESLWQDHLVLIVPAGHRLARRRQTRLDEIADEPFVMRERGSGTRQLMEHQLARRGVELRHHLLAVGSTTAVKQAVLAGLGVSLISERAVRAEVASGTLAVLTLTDIRFDRRFLLVTDPNRTPSPLCSRFVKYLKTRYREEG